MNHKHVACEVERASNKGTSETKIECFLKKKGFAKFENTWEPIENINCSEVIKDFGVLLKKKYLGKEKKMKKANNGIVVIRKKAKMYNKRKKTKPKDVAYEVKKVLKKRITVEGKVEYLLKWKKIPRSENSWEPVENINCPELIEAYENLLKSKALDMKRKRKIARKNTNESVTINNIEADNSREAGLNINSLPEDVFIKIFSYLTQNELGRFALVCKKWSMCAKNPILWKNIDVKFRWIFGSINKVVSNFSTKIPTCLTRISLNFKAPMIWKDHLHFEEFCMDLQKHCPKLQSLILISTKLSVRLPEAVDICSHFLPELEVLALRDCRFGEHFAKEEYKDTSKIKVFDFYSSFCRIGDFKNLFSKMPYLKKLYLGFTNASDVWLYDTSLLRRLEVLEVGRSDNAESLFNNLLNNASNLTELCLCGTKIYGYYFKRIESELPHLKTICLFATDVTCEGITMLIQSFPFVETIYLKEDVAQRYVTDLSSFFLDKCIPNIIRGVRKCNHRTH